MQDGIIMETGNSRYLRSISSFLQAYPTYEAFAQALIAGTLPIDLNGKNADGWAQQGTPLNKANLLTDATAALLELGGEATVNQVLAVLANRTGSTAESSAQAMQQVSVLNQQLTELNTKVGGMITYGTSALSSGSSNLATGVIYVQYE